MSGPVYSRHIFIHVNTTTLNEVPLSGSAKESKQCEGLIALVAGEPYSTICKRHRWSSEISAASEERFD